MFSLVYCKRLLVPNCKYVLDSTTHLPCLSNYASLIAIRSFSSVEAVANDGKKHEEEPQKHHFTVSYLMNSCGLSLGTADFCSKYVTFMSPEKPDSVLRLLRDHGFTNAHISIIVKKKPSLLLSKPEETLLPKLEFFNSIGISSSDIAVMLSRNPSLFTRSLQKTLIPCYDFLKSLVFFNVDENIPKVFERLSWPFLHYVRKNVVANVSILRGHGAPPSIISLFITYYPNVISCQVNIFREHVKEIIGMGFNPSKQTFVSALRVVSTMTKMTWETKMEVYRRWGLSENEIKLAFRKNPKCMTLSEKNITSTVDFLVNKMGWEPSAVVQVPIVLNFSLEKKIIPRCSVIRVLVLKGLFNKEIPLYTALKYSDERFLEAFVTKYQDEMPQLFDIFQGKMGLLELGFAFEQKSDTKNK